MPTQKHLQGRPSKSSTKKKEKKDDPRRRRRQLLRPSWRRLRARGKAAAKPARRRGQREAQKNGKGVSRGSADDVDPEEQAEEAPPRSRSIPTRWRTRSKRSRSPSARRSRTCSRPAAQKGFLTYDEVNDALPADIVSSDQIDDVMSMFGDNDIEIVDAQKAASSPEAAGAAKPAPGLVEEQKAEKKKKRKRTVAAAPPVTVGSRGAVTESAGDPCPPRRPGHRGAVGPGDADGRAGAQRRAPRGRAAAPSAGGDRQGGTQSI